MTDRQQTSGQPSRCPVCEYLGITPKLQNCTPSKNQSRVQLDHLIALAKGLLK